MRPDHGAPHLAGLYPHLDPWGVPRPRLTDRGRVSHLVFVDGRLVDAWSEHADSSDYADVADRHDDERRAVTQLSPPPRPRHERVLEWLDSVVGGRSTLMSLAVDPPSPPALRDALDPVADEPWLVVDELLDDLTGAVLAPDLAGPLRHCLLLLHEAAPTFLEQRSPSYVAGGLVWLVGKANGELGPTGPVRQREVADRLDLKQLTPAGHTVSGRVRRTTWPAQRPWDHAVPALEPTGIPELLCGRVRADVVRMRDDALAEQAATGTTVGA